MTDLETIDSAALRLAIDQLWDAMGDHTPKGVLGVIVQEHGARLEPSLSGWTLIFGGLRSPFSRHTARELIDCWMESAVVHLIYIGGADDAFIGKYRS